MPNGVNRHYEKRETTQIPSTSLPSCARIAEFLKGYGEEPLYSGSTDLGVVGVIVGDDGKPQLALKHTDRC